MTTTADFPGCLRHISTPIPPSSLPGMPPPRWWLHVQAKFLRGFIGVLIRFCRLARIFPKHLKPSFILTIPSRTASQNGLIPLHFYTPPGYTSRQSTARFPVIVNFHGGGFTLGVPEDDARWAETLVNELNAVVVSVKYRLAPEFGFPVAVQDGADAVLYLRQHAAELGLDTGKFVTSGFSAGGNLAVTVPLLLQDIAQGRNKHASDSQRAIDGESDLKVGGGIKAIVAWYPSLDYSRSRRARRSTMTRPEKALPRWLTSLFDFSYMTSPSTQMFDPLLSPGAAPDEVLKGLPEHIEVVACEWDMLCAEAQDFAERLTGLGKNVRLEVVKGVVHGWDKHPRANPDPGPLYLESCVRLRRIFNGDS